MEVKSLGLAAYVMMKGLKLVKVTEDGSFVFECNEKSEREWEIEYVNSCCFRHDNALMTLRRMLQQRKMETEINIPKMEVKQSGYNKDTG